MSKKRDNPRGEPFSSDDEEVSKDNLVNKDSSLEMQKGKKGKGIPINKIANLSKLQSSSTNSNPPPQQTHGENSENFQPTDETPLVNNVKSSNVKGANCWILFKFIAGTLTILATLTLVVAILFGGRLRYLKKTGDPGTVYDHFLADSLEESFLLLEWVSGSFEEYFHESRLLAAGIISGKSTTTNPPKPIAPTQPSWADSKEDVKEFLFELKRKYPSQPQLTWFKLYAGLTLTVTQEVPERPSTFVFLSSSPSTKQFSECFAKEISSHMHTAFAKATGTQRSFNIMEISPESLKSKHIEANHHELNNYLRRGKMVIVRDLDQINIEEHLFLFHAFCDQFEAPEKRATFIFLVTVPPEAEEVAKSLSEQGKENELLELILDAAWTSLESDKRPATISRISSNVIRIQPGDSCGVNDR